MEVSKLLTLTAEERKKRKDEWEERKRVFGQGRDPDKELAQDRAMKALILLKEHLNGTISLTDPQKIAYCGIVVNRCYNDLFFFCKHVLEMDLMTETTHKKWADDHLRSIKLGRKRIMRLKPRATFKTSLYGIGTILYLWGCISPQIRIFYTSANSLLLQEVSDKLSQYIGTEKNETLYSMIFGVTKDVSSKNTSDVINIKGRSGKGFSLILRTAGSSAVGLHPSVILIDDPMDQNDRESAATRSGKEAWMDSLVPLVVPFFDEKTGITLESIFFVSTRHHMKDLVNYILERNKKLPDEQKWDVESESICDDRGKSNYPDFISDEKISELKNSMSDVAFACQYLNNPLPTEMQLFNLTRLTFVRPEQINLKFGEVKSFFDPSLGKAASDIPLVIWMHSFEDRLTVIDAIDKKIELSLIVHQIAAKNQEYGCRHLTFESNGVTLIEQSLRDAHERINHKIYLESIHHSSSKYERICSIQSDLYSGRVQFMSDYLTRYPDGMNQLVWFPVWGTDDFPDCLEMAVSHFRQQHFKFVRYESCL